MPRVLTHPILEVPKPERVSFWFEGRELAARRGEMISSALFAHGIRTFGLHPEDRTPQGIFCANGQCSQCMVIADGRPVKACMTPVAECMRVNQLVNVPRVPELAAGRIDFADIEEKACDLLIIGAGPAGLGAAIEAADAGLSVVLADDKSELGGKLILQTHMFFGSVDQCHAGTRGIDIAAILAAEVARRPGISCMPGTMAVGVYCDGKVGLVEREERYLLLRPRSLLVATGARERALVFPGCELPGVYGAGAFQTLLNRDLVAPAERLFVVGGGNVGLIAAYHALQAGIQVVGLAEALPEIGGYWVHADKIRRMGVPVHTSTTVVSANGSQAVESVTVARMDENWNILSGTHQTYPCDTLLLAVGLEPVNELFASARAFGFDAYVAGDAEEIAEASAAMFSGRLKGRLIARSQGRAVDIPGEWEEMIATLKSKPGREGLPIQAPGQGAWVFPMLWCAETIPCNPCAVVCPQCGIEMPEGGSILSRSNFTGDCRACGKCVAACPALAITLVDLRERAGGKSLVTIPHEFLIDFAAGDTRALVGRKGEEVCEGRVVRITDKRSRAPCSSACPAGVHTQGYIELIRKRKYPEAMELLRRDLPLPAVCGRVCYHPCEDECGRAELDEPIAILALKRFVADWAMQQDAPISALPVTRAERAAVIGSGPSGLACANELLQRGYRVTVFEAADRAGGILRYGIPAYRLPEAVLDWELSCLEKRGIEIRTGARVGSISGLRRQGFGAVYLSTGAPLASRLGIPGEGLAGVRGALEFLREVKTGAINALAGTVAVIGGGNSALDAARAARRLGANAKIVYRRSREQMPAHDWEVADAEAEGVEFEYLASPLRVAEQDGKAAALVCQRMELGEPDESGRRRPIPVAGATFEIPVALVITAVGQDTDLGGLGQELDKGKWNNVVADPLTQATSLAGVFAGGDAVTGPATVVDAFAAGKRAAESIDRFLRGRDLKAGREEKPPVSQAAAGAGAEKQSRARAASLAPEARAGNFQEIVSALSEEQALREAGRCLGCGVYSECMWAAHAGVWQSRERVALITLEVDADKAAQVAGIRVQDPEATRPIATVMPPDGDDDVVVCRCERVTVGQIRRAIRAGVRDMNQLKAMLKAGLGACGGKTCGPLIRALFRKEGVSQAEVTYYTERPLVAEVPLGLFAGAGKK